MASVMPFPAFSTQTRAEEICRQGGARGDY